MRLGLTVLKSNAVFCTLRADCGFAIGKKQSQHGSSIPSRNYDDYLMDGPPHTSKSHTTLSPPAAQWPRRLLDIHQWRKDPARECRSWWINSLLLCFKGRRSWVPYTWVSSTINIYSTLVKISCSFKDGMICYPSTKCSVQRICQDSFVFFNESRTTVSQGSMKRLRELTSALLEIPHFLVPKRGSNINCSGSF